MRREPAGASDREASRPRATAPPTGTATFIGALLPVRGREALLVTVAPPVLTNLEDAHLFVTAYQERFRRPIVLVGTGAGGRPHFYGPADLLPALHALPFELIPWRRFLFDPIPSRSGRLPIPARRAPELEPPRSAATSTTDSASDSTAPARGPDPRGRWDGPRPAWASRPAARWLPTNGLAPIRLPASAGPATDLASGRAPPTYLPRDDAPIDPAGEGVAGSPRAAARDPPTRRFLRAGSSPLALTGSRITAPVAAALPPRCDRAAAPTRVIAPPRGRR
jgi:hypothetical protein